MRQFDTTRSNLPEQRGPIFRFYDQLMQIRKNSSWVGCLSAWCLSPRPAVPGRFVMAGRYVSPPSSSAVSPKLFSFHLSEWWEGTIEERKGTCVRERRGLWYVWFNLLAHRVCYHQNYTAHTDGSTMILWHAHMFCDAADVDLKLPLFIKRCLLSANACSEALNLALLFLFHPLLKWFVV